TFAAPPSSGSPAQRDRQAARATPATSRPVSPVWSYALSLLRFDLIERRAPIGEHGLGKRGLLRRRLNRLPVLGQEHDRARLAVNLGLNRCRIRHPVLPSRPP